MYHSCTNSEGASQGGQPSNIFYMIHRGGRRVSVYYSVLQCIAMSCSAEGFNTIQDNTIQYKCAAVCCSVLQWDAVCCSVLQCVAVGCSVLQWVAVCCSVLQCVAVCCSVLQCVAACCSVLQCVTIQYNTIQSCRTCRLYQIPHFATLPHTAHITIQCNPLQYTVIHSPLPITHCNTLQHTATHCNTLQHTATHCNTLQHTATHCIPLQYTVIHSPLT